MSDEDKRVSLHVGIGHVEPQARELYDERRRHFCNDCQHEPDGQDPFPERCFDCSRYYSDLWEG
mgnify:CR=1 FL=1